MSAADPHAITFTLDLEDLRSDPALPVRVDVVTGQLLDELAELGMIGTVFVVGDIAEQHPELIRRVAADGHELGLHAHRHVPLTDIDRSTFAEETRVARKRLQDLSGQRVPGYRAPSMSLVPDSAWVLDHLASSGFAYSSSILPGRGGLYSWPGAPEGPFRWPNGLIEIPCPVYTMFGRAWPYLGGTYLRVLPRYLYRRGLRQARLDELLWAYCHPWEFDTEEKPYRLDHVGWFTSRMAWVGRRRMRSRIDEVMERGAAPPLHERVSRLAFDELPVFDPAVPVS